MRAGEERRTIAFIPGPEPADTSPWAADALRSGSPPGWQHSVAGLALTNALIAAMTAACLLATSVTGALSLHVCMAAWRLATKTSDAFSCQAASLRFSSEGGGKAVDSL